MIGNEVHSIEWVKESIREHGFSKSFLLIVLKALRRMRRLFYQYANYNLAIYDLTKNMYSFTEDDPSVRCKIFQVQDLENIERDFGNDCAQFFAERMRHSRGYIVYCSDRVAGYAWSCSGILNNEGVKPFLISFQPHHSHIYIYDCFTVPELRNRKLFYKLMRYLLMSTKNDGFKFAFLTFRKDNHPMDNVLKKLNFSIIGEVSCKKILWHIRIDASDMQKVCTLL